MDATRFEELLMRWQDGDASPEENREFEELLRDNAEFRRALVGSVLLEAGLHRRYKAPSLATATAPSRKRVWEAVAALLVVAVSLFAVGRLMFRAEDVRVASGSVWSQGAPASALSDGQAFEVRGLAPATLQLRGGTRVTLDAGSAGSLPAASKPFELSRGSASFQVESAPAPFRVSTPAGGFSASNAQVWILLRPSGRKAVKRPELVVETARGSVDVDAWGVRATVTEGARRVFGPPPPAGDYAGLLDRATLSLSAAIGRAQAAGGGIPVRAELEDEDGRAAFTVGLALEDKVREIELDLKTGEVAREEVEPEDRSRVAAAVTIPLQALVDKVLETTAGRAVEAEFEMKGGRLRAEIKVYGPDGLREVKVDGETGAILSSKNAESRPGRK